MQTFRRPPRPTRRFRRARQFSVAGIVTLSLVLAACSGSGDDESGDSDQITLTMWVAREQYLPTDEFYDALKEKYPNITLKTELQADDALFSQMQRMVAAGQDLPDLVQVDSFFAAPMVDTGVAIDMTDLVTRWEEEDPELFALQSPAVFYKDDDKIVGLGTTGTADVIYYRADWLKEAGYEAPLASWDEVLEALRAIKEKHPDIVPWAMIGTRGEGVNYLLTQMMASGVEFDGAVPQLDTEAGRYVIEFYQTLINDGLATIEALGWGENESRGAWIGGRAAMTLDGIRSSNDLGDAIQEGVGISHPDGWSMMLPPLSRTGEPEAGVHTTATRTFHITSSSEHPYEASLVLREMTETDLALAAAQAGAIYLQKDVLASPDFRKVYPYLADDQIDAIANGATFPASSTFFAVVEVLERMIQDILLNPDESSQVLAQKWQEELDAAAAGE
jgi:ABC-type glycerol-3-phosphate transport system substrate-binding protein